MIKLILSYLLHHANREYRSEDFYRVKNIVLTKYGTPVGYDVQFIEGKKCNSCQGRGYHYRYGRNGQPYDTADCYHCWGGWYKHPAWVLLKRMQLGKYIFHQPIQKEIRFNKNPFTREAGWNVTNEVIRGYIEHSPSKHGKDALIVLYLVYDWKGYWSRWKKHIGIGWRCSKYWWLRPKNWPNNIAHIIRYKGNAIPFHKKQAYVPPSVPEFHHTEDLPF
jgi:hypothetical protein